MKKSIAAIGSTRDFRAAGSPFRSVSFTVLWLSEGVSLIGDRLIAVALVSMIYDRTGSAGAVGLLMLLKALPALLFGGFAGAIADRWNRKWIMVAANFLQGALVFCLPLSQGTWTLFAAYLAMSIVNQFFVPARSATIPDLVQAQALVSANSLFAVAFVAAMALGPAIGTLITDGLGMNAAFFADAVSFMLPAAAVACLSIPRKNPAAPGKGVAEDLMAGWIFARSEPRVRASLAAIASAFFVIGAISVSGVVIVRDVLGMESSKVGIVMSALGVGMLAGAIASRALSRRLAFTKVMAAGVCAMGAGAAALPWAPDIVSACLFAALVGAGMITVQVNGQALLQTIAPDMKGRLMGISQTLTGSVTFLASALIGLLLERLDARIVMGAVGAVVLAATFILAFSREEET